MAGDSKTTTSHDEIRRWVEERGGRPARAFLYHEQAKGEETRFSKLVSRDRD